MENQYYRTFIGLPVLVGPGLLESRLQMMDLLSGERISWVDPERYHITLRFIGDTKIESIDRISAMLKEMVEIPRQTHIRLSQLISFGPRKKPRVICVGFEPDSLFESLRKDVDAALEACGIPPVEQPFRPHLTLGRPRSIKDLTGFYDILAANRRQFEDQVLFDRVVFYRSELGKGGPRYTALEEISFRE